MPSMSIGISDPRCQIISNLFLTDSPHSQAIDRPAYWPADWLVKINVVALELINSRAFFVTVRIVFSTEDPQIVDIIGAACKARFNMVDLELKVTHALGAIGEPVLTSAVSEKNLLLHG